MSYQIGQLRDSDIVSDSEYFKEIEVVQKEDISLQTAFSDISFNDLGLSSSASDFLLPGVNYYLRFTVDRYEFGTFDDPSDLEVDTMNFTIYLLKEGIEAGTYETVQTLDSFSVLPYSVGETQEDKKYVTFEIMFTPSDSSVTRIGFILKRKRYDYREEGQSRHLLVRDIKYGIIQNILIKVPGIGASNASKIGVQSKPGFLMCINGEAIRVGKTGVYEINNGVPISFFGIASLKEHYILDCAWNNS